MENYESWMQKLENHCRLHGVANPIYQDVSDRRGGRTAWSSIVSVNGVPYSARFWYDGKYVEQARQDAAEVAFNTITAGQKAQSPLSASSYASRSHAGNTATA